MYRPVLEVNPFFSNLEDRHPQRMKLLYWLLFSAGLATLHFPIYAAISIGLLIYIFGNDFSQKWFTRFNLIFGCLTGSYFISSLNTLGKPSVTWAEICQRYFPDASSWQIALSIIGLILICFLIYWILFQIANRFRWFHPALLVLLLVFALFFVLGSSSGSPFISLLLIGIILFFSKTFWMLVYQFSEIDFISKYSVLDHFATLSPPWQQTWSKYSVLRGFSDFLNHRLDSKAAVINMRSAVILIWWAVVLNGLKYAVYKINFSSANENLFHFSVLDFIGPIPDYNLAVPNDIALWKIAYISCITCIIFLLALASTTHSVVALARMFGFSVRKNFDAPYKARSFNDFMLRIYFYYISILLRIFYFPLWSKLRWMRSKSGRLFVTSFLTIFLGGLIDTYMRSTLKMLELGFADYFRIFGERFYYFLSLSIVIGISSVLHSGFGKPARPRPALLQAMFALFYFLIYTICFSLQLWRFQ
jgi:hypothetical protein